MSSDIEVEKLELQPFIKRSVTTANGNVGGTTLVDATLVEAANFWNGCWVLIRTGTYAGQVRMVTGFASPTITLDHTVGGQIVAGTRYVMSLVDPLEAKIDDLEAKLGEIANPEAEAGPVLPRLLWVKNGVRRGAGTILPVNTSLYDWILTRAAPGDAMALTPAERLIVQALILNDATPFPGANIPAILTDTADMQPRVPRIVCSMDFWGDTIEELQLTSVLQANLALTGADVVIAGLPAGVTLTRVVVMFMWRALENTNVAANKLNGVQHIEVNFNGGAFIDAINWADDLFGVADRTREMGSAILGSIDVKATVTGNGTCTFRIDAARADQDNLNFNDYQVGIRVFFTV